MTAPGSVTISGWQEASVAETASLYEAERARWIGGLAWDPRPQFSAAEAARTAGLDSGLVARDATGAPRAWAIYGKRDGGLHIGMLAGGDRAILEALLREVFLRAAAARCSRLSCFLYPGSDAVAPALEAQGFSLQPHLYLRKEIAGLSPDAAAAEPAPGILLRAGGVEADKAARLLARAYAGTPMAARFAPRATLEEWTAWLQQVRHGVACGEFAPAASFAAEDHRGQLLGMILTTRLAPSVAHVAQLAVDPEARRRNIARGLLAAASTAAFSLGCSAVTLLVAGDNRPALDLYFGRGFRPVATMLYGFAKGKGVR